MEQKYCHVTKDTADVFTLQPFWVNLFKILTPSVSGSTYGLYRGCEGFKKMCQIINPSRWLLKKIRGGSTDNQVVISGCPEAVAIQNSYTCDQ